MILFRISGGLCKTQHFLSSIRVFTLEVPLGGIESLEQLPTLMSRRDICPTERSTLGTRNDLIRLSVGVEEGRDPV